MNKFENAIIPIAVGNSDGNAVIVGDLLITAGHVASEGSSIHIEIGNDYHILGKDDAVLYLKEESNNAGLYNDIAIFKLPKCYNNLAVDCSTPEVGSVLQSLSFKHIVEKHSTGEEGIFGTMYKDNYQLCISKATVVDTIGNFIICEMEEPLEEGRSGSPLFNGDKIIGILHGGIEGKTCVFQSISSIPSEIFESRNLF